ncbi:subclass B1 metallo-beta-lactamase [Shewanella sp. JM162201]|uniref:beta-lactamase n=1 Tax=Shewanella jiangmenensis TaxID=2837387 RepID=A0ABS5V2X9_9GAMM|nr:subclass B1 metallo-beta-lactamase [Shewanella jiangmenensis]MBT1444802.1 subclass B1 metallo-beta-lactamase [Shewanella jiangmenensis]
MRLFRMIATPQKLAAKIALPLLVSLCHFNAAALEITPLDDGLYLHQSQKQVEGFGLVDANGLVVLNGKEAFVIDSPWTEEDAKALLEWAKARGISIKAVLATHWHDDRAGGFAVFEQAGIATVSSNLTQQLLRENHKTPATQTFGETRKAFLDGKVDVLFPGAGHTLDNLVVYLPDYKLLYGGCLIRALETRTMGYTEEGDVTAWPQSVAKVEQVFPDIVTVIPGHGAKGDASMLKHTRELAQKLLDKPR